jgi:hypothetical protein
MAVACSGCCSASTVAALLDEADTQEAAVKALPSVASAAKAAAEGAPHNETDVTLFAITWSAERGPEGWMVATDRLCLGPRYVPGLLVGVDQIVMPSLGPDIPASAAPNYRDPAVFDPEVQAATLVAAQRMTQLRNGACFIGGTVELTTAGPAGAFKQTVAAWDDRVGMAIAA